MRNNSTNLSTRRPSFRPNFRAEAKRGASFKEKPRDRSEYFDYPDNWAEISAYVRRRDGYRCQYHKHFGGQPCNVYAPPPYSGQLHVHHLTSGKDRSHHPKDLTTVCQQHHRACHKHMQKRK